MAKLTTSSLDFQENLFGSISWSHWSHWCNWGNLKMWLKYPRHFFTVYVKINTNTLKAKIPKECLHTALLSSSSVSHHVSIWRNKLLKPFHLELSQKNITNSHTDRPDSISIATCNCRGLRNLHSTFDIHWHGCDRSSRALAMAFWASYFAVHLWSVFIYFSVWQQT